MANILVVEDDPQLNLTYDILLKKVGHEVGHAYNGFEALEQMDAFKPEIVLLDYRMPKMDGIEFLRQVDLPTNYPKVKVILFSNMDQGDQIEEAFQLGIHKSVLKSSIAPTQLVEMIEKLIRSK